MGGQGWVGGWFKLGRQPVRAGWAAGARRAAGRPASQGWVDCQLARDRWVAGWLADWLAGWVKMRVNFRSILNF